MPVSLGVHEPGGEERHLSWQIPPIRIKLLAVIPVTQDRLLVCLKVHKPGGENVRGFRTIRFL